MGWASRAFVAAALALLFVAGASTHAGRVNTSKARGDQSGYLQDAKNIYANWHETGAPRLIGERNRMPLYPAVLLLAYDPWRSDDTFFERAKRLNIYLALLLLGAVWWLAARTLTAHAAANLTGVAAFGWFVFKAGYSQSELLFYTFFFAAFLACTSLFSRRPRPGLLPRAAVAGGLCGLAHLTKAATLPFVGLTLAIGLAWAVSPVAAPRHTADGTRAATMRVRMSAIALLAAVFLLCLWPYISTSKRVFGSYFYNVNSTFYAWYDSWPQASVGTALHGDGAHFPDMPAAELPGPSRYWRAHTTAQIVARMNGGFRDMGVVLRRDFDLLPYLGLYLGTALLLMVARPRAAAHLVAERAWQSVFVAVYGVTYLLATAFYHPISGTGTGRFLLAHALPLFYVLARFIASDRFSDLEGRIAGVRLVPAHFDRAVTTVLLFNCAVRLWPRLMGTYGGF